MSFDISRYCVLVADDDPLTLKLAAEILHAADYDIERVADGEAAWAAILADPERFDAVVLDRRMPGLSGVEVLKRMKGQVATRDIPVVLLSGDAGTRDIAEGIEAGAYHYVTKPYDGDLLVAVLRAAIEEHRSFQDTRQQLRLLSDAHRQLEQTLSAFALFERAEFRLRTPQEARTLATLLAAVAPHPERIVTGLWELLVNAIEHGNLAISYDEKSALLKAGALHEEIARRLEDPRYAAREVEVRVTRSGRCLRYRISDGGAGFDPAPFLDFAPSRATHAHGRGIALARRLSFDAVCYLGAGNVVEAEVRLAAADDGANAAAVAVAVPA